MKTQKGITLIALIITIIVMLILVGVSVSVALNTGLFKTAQEAAKNTEAERVNETKLSTGMVTIKNATTGELEEVDINSFAGTPKLDLSGAEGTPVTYSAGGVNDWKIWKKNESAGTVTILGEVRITDWSEISSNEELLNYLNANFRNPIYKDAIENVEIISMSKVIDVSRI